jgi:hypothetical protein
MERDDDMAVVIALVADLADLEEAIRGRALIAALHLWRRGHPGARRLHDHLVAALTGHGDGETLGGVTAMRRSAQKVVEAE